MKKVLVIVLVLLGWAATCFVSYYTGNSRGKQYTVTAEKGAFVASLSTMEALRDGNTNKAYSILENHCYATAVSLMQKCDRNEDVVLTALMPELLEYRKKFAADSSKYTPIERRFLELLPGVPK